MGAAALFVYISCTDQLRGHELPQAGSPLTGGSLFLHRLSGAHELPQAGSPLTGGSFFCTG